MAKQAAESRVNTPSASDVIGWAREVVQVQRDIDKSASELAGFKGVKAGVFRRAKKAGAHMEAFRNTIRDMGMDEDELLDRRKHEDQYGGMLGVKYYRAGDEAQPQGAMFEDDPKAKEASQGLQDARITTDGYNSRRGGQKIEDNPHEPGSRDHQTWAAAWGDADRDMEEGLPPIGQKASAEKRPAGSGKGKKALPAPTKAAKKVKGAGRSMAH